MPNGRTHEIINLSGFGVLAGGYLTARLLDTAAPSQFLFATETLTAFAVSYLIGTLFVTPDLDLAENRVRAKNNWGILGWLWTPYGKMFRHRGMSHTWFVGPFTRLLYMFAIIVVLLGFGFIALIVAALSGASFEIRFLQFDNGLGILLGAVLGYYLSQWLHLIADGVWPDHGLKRRKKKSNKKR